MGKGLVVYDSYFGNTEQIAKAVAAALGDSGARALKVSEVTAADLTGLSLLVVGSPTRAFSATPPVKKLLASLPSGALTGVRVAAFDTRMDVQADKAPGILRFMAGLFGYAAEPIAKALVRRGGRQAAAPAGFIVVDSEGPLKDGELQRAANWARPLAAAR